MSDATPPPDPGPSTGPGPATPGFGPDVRRLFVDLAEMARVRRELAELELRTDIASSKRLAWSAGVGAVLALTGLPLLALAAAALLRSWHPLGTETINGWVPLLAGVFLLTGGLLVWTGYRRFRSDFRGFRQSLAELREDIDLIREWARGGEPAERE